MFLKKILTVLSIIVFSYCGIAFGQQDSVQSIKSINSLNDGAWALQLAIEEDFSLKSFQGQFISIKYHFSQKQCVRLGTGLGFDNSYMEYNENGFDHIDRITDSDSIGFGVAVQFVRYVSPPQKLVPFYGLGPVASLSKTKTYTQSFNPSNELTSVNKHEIKYSFFGLSVVFGAEWFPKENISLLAEYETQFGHKSRNNTHEYIYGSGELEHYETDMSGWKLNSSNVKFGLSLYF